MNREQLVATEEMIQAAARALADDLDEAERLAELRLRRLLGMIYRDQQIRELLDEWTSQDPRALSHREVRYIEQLREALGQARGADEAIAPLLAETRREVEAECEGHVRSVDALLSFANSEIERLKSELKAAKRQCKAWHADLPPYQVPGCDES